VAALDHELPRLRLACAAVGTPITDTKADGRQLPAED
jgi:hypothetical protein